jgi:hypothetical protein
MAIIKNLNHVIIRSIKWFLLSSRQLIYENKCNYHSIDKKLLINIINSYNENKVQKVLLWF